MPELSHPSLPPGQTIHVTEDAAVDHYLPAGWLRVTEDQPAEPAPSEPDAAGLDLSEEGD